MLLLPAAQRGDDLVEIEASFPARLDAGNLAFVGPAVNGPAADIERRCDQPGIHETSFLLRLFRWRLSRSRAPDLREHPHHPLPDLVRVQDATMVRGAVDDALSHRPQHLEQDTDLASVPG